ncbi:MAG: polysaccharide biosynthesis C-terminal domain-containing protein, partial [Fimbriimonadaceae bacterium]|nr:polysaccharide biosynthesis C-terminal domain-containing protein [Fimbriimonadaceae bacterium]
VVTFPEAGLVSILQPQMIRAYRDGRMEELHRLYRSLGWGLFKSTLVTTVVATVGLLVSLHLFIKEPIYRDQLPAFFIVMLGAVCNALAMWPRNMLYAMGRDKDIVVMSVLAVVPFIILAFALARPFGILGVAGALLTGFLIRFLLGIYFVRKTRDTTAPPSAPAEGAAT